MTVVDVDVIIPALDRAAVLPRALRSIEQQTVQPRAVIVIDDGSTDSTAQVAQDWGALVLRNEAPAGSGPARNQGLNHATATWVAFLDSDDEWLPHHLEELTSKIEDADLICAATIDTRARAHGNLRKKALVLTPARLLFPDNPVCTSGTLARRQALLNLGGFGSFQRAQDLDLWLRLTENPDYRAIAISSVTSRYYVAPPTSLAQLEKLNAKGLEAVLQSHAQAPWFTPPLRRALAARQLWDRTRSALRRGDWPTARQGAARIMTSHESYLDMIRLLRERSLQRSRGRAISQAS